MFVSSYSFVLLDPGVDPLQRYWSISGIYAVTKELALSYRVEGTLPYPPTGKIHVNPGSFRSAETANLSCTLVA